MISAHIRHLDGDPSNNAIENLEYVPDEPAFPHKFDRHQYPAWPCANCGRPSISPSCPACGKRTR